MHSPVKSHVLPSTIGVLGAGQMGRGIAQVAAQAGCSVLLADVDLARAEAGRAMIGKGLESLVQKGKMDPSVASAVMERIHPRGGAAQLADSQFVIEAATENEVLKRELFLQLDKAVAPGVILATNTSSISITRLAAATSRPQQVIGMHFMNPPPIMTLVEVIRGEDTRQDTYELTCALITHFGKTVVTSSDYPGFIVNRILMPMINEAAYALMEGVASVEDIDAAMRLGTNQPMGPLALADLIGLDTCVAILEVMHKGLGDPKYRPCPLLRRLVDSGRLGRKSPRGGFYTKTA